MANVINHYPLMNTAEGKAYNKAMERVKASTSRFRGQNEHFRELNKYYFSLSPSLRSRVNDRPLEGKTTTDDDLFVPMSFAIIESMTPTWLFTMFGHKPAVRILGRTLDDHNKASVPEKLIDYDFDRSQLFLNTIPYAKQLFKYGTGIGEVTYKRTTRIRTRVDSVVVPKSVKADGSITTEKMRITHREPTVEYDGPFFEHISVFNAFPDPLYHRLNEMRFFAKRYWTDRSTLEEKDEEYRKHSGGKSLYKNLKKIPPIKRGGVEAIYQLDGDDGTAEAMGWSGNASSKGHRWGSFGQRMQGMAPSSPLAEAEMARDMAVEVIRYYERDRIIEIANGETVIRDSENELEDIPIVATPCFSLEGQFWGMGMLSPAKRPQEEINSWRNLAIKQGRLNMLNIWAYDNSETKLPPNAFSLDPGDVIGVRFSQSGKPLMVPLYAGHPLPPEAQWIESRIHSDVQRALAFSDFRMGGQGGSGTDTATEARMLQAGASNRDRLQAALGEETFLTQVGKKYLKIRQAFGDEETMIRIVGKDYREVDFKRITQEDIEGEFDFVPIGTVMHPSPDILRQQILEALAIVKGDPVLMELSDPYEILLQVWKTFEFPFPARFMRPPAEKTISAEIENAVLSSGQWIEVTPNENHQKHVEIHDQGMQEAIKQGNEEALKLYQQHQAKHNHFLELSAAAPPPQEEPGVMQGGAGQQPGAVAGQNAGTPTQGGLAGKVQGGGG